MKKTSVCFAAILSCFVLTNVSESSSRSERLLKQLEPFVKTKEITPAEAVFFAAEAARAGVRTIRQMRRSEKPRRLGFGQTGCGRATFSNVILIDFDRRRCINYHNLSHEISHIAMYKKRCKGHGDRFYQYNYGIAKRLARISGRKGRRLQNLVLKRSQNYRIGAAGCKGSVNIRS